MANIQWYPGHMHKTAREMREGVSRVDVFIELIDARIPHSSRNPLLAEIRATKPCLKVMMRADLADPARTSSWLDWFANQGEDIAIAASRTERDKLRSLISHCRKLFPQRETSIIAMVIGIPNVGKSTLINILANRKVAKTGDEPAITKMQQRIPLGQGVVLLDTPGVLWPNIENPASGLRLAATGAIRETAINHQEVAWFLASFLLSDYKQLLVSRYQSHTDNNDPARLLDHIGRLRGCLKAGGKVDLARVSRVLLNDFASGSIGRITLETPGIVQAEKREVEKAREEKAAKKAARKDKWKNRKGE
jgi:ribosome biogenesis GTPase A